MKKCPKCGTEYPDSTTLCPSDGVALEQIGDPLIGLILAGKYRIDERLSEGGMGAVYRATHVLMGKTVAVKVLRPSLAADEKIVARFSREARAASCISHPHALSVTDFGESDEGIVFLVMEYLSGETLKGLIRKQGPLALPRAVEILRQVGGALEAAHEQGVVHRDLKSDNIMLLTTSGVDYAKVLDFGIAKIKERDGAYDPGLTAPDLVMGTPQYMSPEQCSQSRDIDARSDIYSLGVILYEMLVGKVPFTGDSPTTIMLKHLQEQAPSVLEQRKELPQAVAHVVARAMAKLPESRYQSVREFVEDLTIAADPNRSTASPDIAAAEIEITAPSVAFVTDQDEQTLVRPRQVTRIEGPPFAVPAQTAPQATGLNPWKILIPSLLGLLVIFGFVWAFTKKSETTNSNQFQPTLVADPNSRPVEAVSPATGKPEEGIPAGGATTNTAASTNTNKNAKVAGSPSPVVDANANTSENKIEKADENVNNRPAPSVALPSPSAALNTNSQPSAPAPTPKPPSPKATAPTSSASPITPPQ